KAKLQAIANEVDEADKLFDARHPEASAPALSKGLELTRALIASLQASKLPEEARHNALHELELKRDQFNLALGQSLGMSLVATVQRGLTREAREPGRMGPLDGGAVSLSASRTAIAGQAILVDLH